MDFWRDQHGSVHFSHPELGDLITVVINGQLRHCIVTEVHDHPDGSFKVSVRLDPTEPPLDPPEE